MAGAMETYVDNGVTGAVAEVQIEVDQPPSEVWAIVTDVGRIGEWSPECVFAAWRPGQGEVPRVGARFDARNEYADGFRSSVECVVREAVPPHAFEWIVLDDDSDETRPGSIWRYEIEPTGDGRTRVRHRFTHGAGMTGLRESVDRFPDRADTILAARRGQLERNMVNTLSAMLEPKRSER
jgi:uncharacterized protein YndB with AHSA1/START domain